MQVEGNVKRRLSCGVVVESREVHVVRVGFQSVRRFVVLTFSCRTARLAVNNCRNYQSRFKVISKSQILPVGGKGLVFCKKCDPPQTYPPPQNYTVF